MPKIILLRAECEFQVFKLFYCNFMSLEFFSACRESLHYLKTHSPNHLLCLFEKLCLEVVVGLASIFIIPVYNVISFIFITCCIIRVHRWK